MAVDIDPSMSDDTTTWSPAAFFAAAAVGDAAALAALVPQRPAVWPIDTPDDRNAMTALELAVCAAEPAAVAVLAAAGSDRARAVDTGALMAAVQLGFADVLEALLLPAAALQRACDDGDAAESDAPLAGQVGDTADVVAVRSISSLKRVGSVPIYVCGGQTLLHVAADKSHTAVSDALFQLLPDDALAAMLAVRDDDGATPLEVAHCVGFSVFSERAAAVLGGPAALAAVRAALPDPVAANRERLHRRAVRITAAAKAAEAAEREHRARAAAASTSEYYTPSCAFQPPVRLRPESNAVQSRCACTADPTCAVRTVCDGVYAVDAFSPALVDAWRDEIHAVYKAVPPDAPIRRPNSMNKYGFVLQELGFGPWLRVLADTVLAPLAARLPDTLNVCVRPDGTTTEDDDAPPPPLRFGSVHGFVIRYAMGEDRDLAEHMDKSDFTFNICLGYSGFQGATLFFKTDEGAPLCTYEHAVGTAVVHRGQIRHGAHPLTAGERVNLVVWCRVADDAY